MKRGLVVTLVLCAFIAVGCKDDKNEEMLKEISSLQTESSSLKQDITARDQYIDEVIQAVNDVTKDLELAKSKEANLLQKTQSMEGQPGFTNEDVRETVLKQISAINFDLKANRRKIASLQHTLKASDVAYASLNDMVQNLKQALDQRQQSIVALQQTVDGLQGTVAAKDSLIGERDTVIENQKNQMNTVYYIVGKKDDLKQKGIITDEGGFLWGLLGSTTVMSGKIDESDFKSIDLTQNPAIHVDGRVMEILPKRNNESFAIAQIDNKNGELMIKHPGKFWQQKYLVIVVD